jgi:ABC-type multidrug transport system permease subunit
MPHFIVQRSIFEARERASRTYSWVVFVLVNIIVELPWTLLSAFFMFITWYYPLGMNENANGATAERGGLIFLLLWTFMLFGATFTDMVIVAIETAELGALTALTLYTSCLVFCGYVLVFLPPP